MIAFFFPIILGALIGFTLDDGNIDKSDFKYAKKQFKEGAKPLVKKFNNIKDGFKK